jgi:hypothetical protein
MKKTPLVRRTNFGDNSKDKGISNIEVPVPDKIDLTLSDHIGSSIENIKPLIFSNLPLPKGQITDKELGFLEDKK